MCKKIVYVLILCHLISMTLRASNDIYFSKIGMEQGLSQLSVMTIYQDELGVMWFGTREGISKFNGNSIEKIIPSKNDSNSLINSVIKTICGDRNGHVYVHSQDGVNEFNLRTSTMRVIQKSGADAIAYGITNLWIAENNKIYSYKNGTKSFYTEVEGLKSPILKILQTGDQRLVVGTLTAVYIIDQNRKNRCVIDNTSQVSAIFEDDKKNIWVGTWHNGLYKIDRSSNVRNFVKHDGGGSISSNFVRAIIQDNKQNIWIGTRRGLEKLNPENEKFSYYQSGGSPSLELSNESVWSMYKDPQGNIWIGTYFGGVNYFNPEIDYYSFHNLTQGYFYNRPFPTISQIIEDKNKQLLLCTEGDGLVIYNPDTKAYSNLRTGNGNRNLSSDNIKTGYYDAQKHEVWLGTHLGGITRVNLNTLQTKQIRHIKNEWTQSDIVRVIMPYNNELLVGTYNGVFLLNPNTYEMRLFSEKLHKKVSYIVDMLIVGDDLWIASIGLFRYNMKTSEITSYFNIKNNPYSLSNNDITKLFLDSKKRLWIATSGGGVNQFLFDKEQFAHYDTQSSGFNNDYISNIIETKFGYLYIASTQGLTVLDPEASKSYNYSSANGFPLNSLFNGGMKASTRGEIFVAGMNGMISFAEDNLLSTQKAFNLYFSNLWINNTVVKALDETNILDRSLPYTNNIKLNHKQSMITIEFTTNNYINFNKPSYRYRLEGQSDAWTTLPAGVNRLNFMNLTPGKYILNLQAISDIDNQVLAATTLNLQINPPFYKTAFAYLLYILFAAFVIWRYLIFVRSKLLLKTSLDYEKKQKEQIEEVNQSKLRFFTNISHEFRTPLTLIAGQVDMLIQTANVPPHIYNRILNIKRNTLNMQNLINELLEFRKTEQGHLNIKVSESNIVDFVYEIYLGFVEYAGFRNINIAFKCDTQNIKLWFDAVQLQKALYNLISNAFKFTPQNGFVELKIIEMPDKVQIIVSDSGIGISQTDIDKIFDRFYQAENGLQINNMAPGTGIGLALTKSIIEAHHAQIEVSSSPNVGTSFCIALKKSKQHFKPEQIIDAQELNSSNIYFDALDTEFINEIREQQNNHHTAAYNMLIVEDNDDLRQMLQQMFEPLFNIHTARDGEEGLQKTIELQPDIVLSDLMMPKMSGSEMCSKIKNNFNVCHIPVVLLTAQTAIEYNIEGLRLGADDYVTKPFNVKALISRCNNLINNRKMLQEKYSKQVDAHPRQLATNELDREFMEKAQRIIEEHLDDSEFDVPAFSREMALGRTKLFSKIKGITGQTPNDFIVNIKLKKAAFWLNNNPELNISDITYKLGFSSPKYFSKCFKEQFGITPSAYRKNDSAKEDDENEDDE